MNQSPRYWSLTLNAHLEATRINLCKLYDQHKNSLGMYKWLKYFKDHIEKPGHYETQFAQKFQTLPLKTGEIDKDLTLVSKKDPKVKKLIAHRGNAVAHVNAKSTATGKSVLHSFPMTYSDYEELISRAEKIFNRYHVSHTGVYRSPKTLQQEKDHEYILDAISEKNVTNLSKDLAGSL